jgi:hypothetical protein
LGKSSKTINKKKITASQTVKIRKYRIIKKRRISPTIQIKHDLGEYEELTTIKMPIGAEIETVIKGHNPNPNLIKIRIGEITCVTYKNLNKWFWYDKNGNYAGESLDHDIKNAFTRFGQILKALKKLKRILYSTITEKSSESEIPYLYQEQIERIKEKGL